jgi:hypothetical protein
VGVFSSLLNVENCKGSAFAYRTDIAHALAFIHSLL